MEKQKGCCNSLSMSRGDGKIGVNCFGVESQATGVMTTAYCWVRLLPAWMPELETRPLPSSCYLGDMDMLNNAWDSWIIQLEEELPSNDTKIASYTQTKTQFLQTFLVIGTMQVTKSACFSLRANKPCRMLTNHNIMVMSGTPTPTQPSTYTHWKYQKINSRAWMRIPIRAFKRP